MKELIESIAQKHRDSGIDIYPPATSLDITAFEEQTGYPLPNDFKKFYSICNGFGCTEDIFNILPLEQIRRYPQDYGTNWFYFSEYMIYSDMWGLRTTSSDQFEIFNGSYPDITMTTSLIEFLNKFLKGNVFESGGLYEWQAELGIK